MLKKYNMLDDFNGTKQYVLAKNDKNQDVIMVSNEYHHSLEHIIDTIIKIEPEKLKYKPHDVFIKSLILNDIKDKRIKDAFLFFIESIESKLYIYENHGEYLLKLRDALVNISCVNIIAASDEDSYTIFEILNARGIELEDHELLKNYIMRYIEPKDERDKAKTAWSDIEDKMRTHMSKFIKHYAVHKYGHDNDISSYKMIQQHTKKDSTHILLHDIMQKSDYYSKLVNPRFKGDEKIVLRQSFWYFHFLRKEDKSKCAPSCLV